MKIAFRLALLVAFTILGFWLWTVFFPGPQKLVLRRISSLAIVATISTGDSNIVRAGKAANLVRFFSPDAEIIFDAPGPASRTLSGRDEIRETALAAFASISALNVQFLDVTIRVSADRQTAAVTCTAKVNADNNKDFGVQEMRFQLKKVDGDWLISRAETVKTLS